MRQPGGIGSRVEWHDPADHIESLLGFRRYFTLENKICKALFDLAQHCPKEWRGIRAKVVRRDREQTAAGALQSAVYAAAFAIQAANMRAAANHVIQSTGAELTKRLQRRVWDEQPSGVSHWIVMPMNVHDELLAPTRKRLAPIVYSTVEEFRKIIPLIKIVWKESMQTWADK
jgi:hypothetical protein